MPRETAFAAELAWQDYDARVHDGGTPILIPIGSMEQHGHHMPMHVDVLLPTEFARRVANTISALVAPPFTYGYKSHQKSGGGNHLPGTTASTAPHSFLRCATWSRSSRATECDASAW